MTTTQIEFIQLLNTTQYPTHNDLVNLMDEFREAGDCEDELESLQELYDDSIVANSYFISLGKDESTINDSVSFISDRVGVTCALDNSDWTHDKITEIERTYGEMISELKEKGLAFTTDLGDYIYTA